MKRAIFGLIVVIGLTCAGSARATDYDEGVNGDLSGNRNAPTSIVLAPGSNLITATSVSGDLEYFNLSIPLNHSLSSIRVVSYVAGDNLAFLAVQQGTTFTEPNTGTNVANLLGWSHFGPGNSTVGTDILDNVGTGAGAIGFTPPLSASNYTFWAQQTGGSASTYVLDFQVAAPVPALSAPLMIVLIGALCVAAFFVMRRRNQAITQA
jgi:hypothetical protein